MEHIWNTDVNNKFKIMLCINIWKEGFKIMLDNKQDDGFYLNVKLQKF